MKIWLAWLWSFFVLGAVSPGADADAGDADTGDADANADAGDGAADADAGNQDDDLGVDLDAGGDQDDGDGGTEAAKVAAKALKDSEAETARLRAELETARRQPQGTPAPSDDQRMFEQEEAKLRDAKTTELERWQIQSNRTLRENKRTSAQALYQAQDLNDKTSFDQIATTKPALHKRYAQRVEEKLKELRSNGQNLPRGAILRILVGDDAINGALAPKKAAKAKDEDTTTTTTVDRGKSPGARSDVAGRGRLTEAQRREKRLENLQI